MTRGAGTAVVHLVRAANDPAVFEAFMRSYEAHEAGAEHELVLLLKGFTAADAPALGRIRERAAAHRPAEVPVDDAGLDLTAYLAAAERVPQERLVFLNSFSEVLVGGWLAALADPLDDHRTGATSATGSWGSPFGYGLWQAGWAGGYGAVYDDRRRTREALHGANGLVCPSPPRYAVANAVDVARHVRHGALFPAPHLRTNALALRASTLRALGLRRPATKRQAYALESGRSGLTARLAALGLAALVVDHLGRAREPHEWPASDGFWQGTQGDLLVADNQTRLFDAATPAQQRALRRYAWGLQARSAGRDDG